MQNISNFLKRQYHYLLLLLITMIAYWPLTFNLYSLKNDALVYFLPYRYHISEAIQNGYFPWWNPYLYTGLPLHSDIQSGVWNPVVMIISLFTTYNVTVLQWELLFYLLLAAIGMYKLVREFGCTKNTSLIAAVAYLCCGFITDSGSLVPWITSAAYLPFVFLYFFRLIHQPCLKNSLKLSLALSLLLTAGYPSFFIFCVYILFAAAIIQIVVSYRNTELKSLLLFLSVSFIVFLIISSPAILSWWDFMSYYERGSGASLVKIQTNSFPVFSSISYLLPSAVSKDHEWLSTDRSARNASVGIFVFIFFLLGVAGKLKGLQRFFLVVLIFSFLFNLGNATPLREWCHRWLPFMNSFRHPASMRVFTSIAIILLAANPINEFFTSESFSRKRLTIIALSLVVFLLVLLVAYIPKSDWPHINFSLSGKALLDKLSFDDIVVLQGTIQILFLIPFIYFLFKRNKKYIPALFIINSVLFCWMALPFTFISQVKASTVNQYISSFPKGYPLPDLEKPVITSEDSLPPSPLGQEKFYNKTICIQNNVITPTINTSYGNFLNDKQLRSALNGYPFVYFSDISITSTDSLQGDKKIVFFDKTGRSFPTTDHTNGTIRVLKFANNFLAFEIKEDGTGLLNLFQQYHHGWRAFEDDNEIPVYRTNRAFMSVPVSAGTHRITFRYEPLLIIKMAMYTSLFILLLIATFFIFRIVKYKRPG